MICECTGVRKTEGGWTRRWQDDMWVCGVCLLPTPLFLEGYLMKKSKEPEAVPTHLNLLRGGILHNKLLTNEELLSRVLISQRPDGKELLAHLAEYLWTPEVIYGSESGTPARVWVHKESS